MKAWIDDQGRVWRRLMDAEKRWNITTYAVWAQIMIGNIQWINHRGYVAVADDDMERAFGDPPDQD